MSLRTSFHDILASSAQAPVLRRVLTPDAWWRNFLKAHNDRRDSVSDLCSALPSLLHTLRTAPGPAHADLARRAVELTAYDLFRADSKDPVRVSGRHREDVAIRVLSLLYRTSQDVVVFDPAPATTHRVMTPFLGLVDRFQAQPCYFDDQPWPTKALVGFLAGLGQMGDPDQNEARAVLMQACDYLKRGLSATDVLSSHTVAPRASLRPPVAQLSTGHVALGH